jgi:hypothetical protein
MRKRYEVVLDGVELDEAQYGELGEAIGSTVRDFLAERGGGDGLDGLDVTDDPAEAERRQGEIRREAAPVTFPPMGLWISKP